VPVSAPLSFYLGIHRPGWLPDARLADVPTMVSHATLAGRKTRPRAVGRWTRDSEGFSVLKKHGRHITTPKDFAAAVIRDRDEIGGMDWASPQDWMCEPELLAKTGLTVREHQRRTIDSVLELRALGAPVIPVLQGWRLPDYLECVELYRDAGVDLRREPIVGLGSVCRRQAMGEAAVIVRALHALGLLLHGFGVKITGLLAFGHLLASADSMAWSFEARWDAVHGVSRLDCDHKTCANCIRYALHWRDRLLRLLAGEADARCRQGLLFTEAA
jgi:hypothetical protein